MAEQALAHSAARDYIWGGPITPLVYVAHSMGGFHSRLYRDRNPERVGALVLCDPVNADSVLYPGILHQFPSTPSIQPSLTSLGLARILTWMRLPIFDAIFELPYQYQALYLNIIARAQWFETSRDEWTWWPDNAQRCKETQPLGDLPLKVLVADASTALYPSETVKVAQLSTNSTIIHFPGQPHGFIMHAENEEKIESLIKDSWNTVIARNKKKVLGW
jgi:pimeloyl-ACP methyl ester carboxylesterase